MNDSEQIKSLIKEHIALCGSDGEHELITVYMTEDDSKRFAKWLNERQHTGHWEWKTSEDEK